jgi:hypothetical protein
MQVHARRQNQTRLPKKKLRVGGVVGFVIPNAAVRMVLEPIT